MNFNKEEENKPQEKISGNYVTEQKQNKNNTNEYMNRNNKYNDAKDNIYYNKNETLEREIFQY